MLTVSDLTLDYEGAVVLRFGSMRLAAGESCLIAGPSGCGKTTLLHALAGFLTPIEGSVVINGVDITRLTEAKRDRFRGRHIGMIFQTLHLVKHLTVMENLLLASYAAGVTQHPAQCRDALAALGIADKENELPERLSQGQQQRVAIARAILHKPSLILADEPTSSLDDAACETVIGLIKKVAKEQGAALVISTHDSRVKAHFSNVVNLGGAS